MGGMICMEARREIPTEMAKRYQQARKKQRREVLDRIVPEETFFSATGTSRPTLWNFSALSTVCAVSCNLRHLGKEDGTSRYPLLRWDRL